MPTAPHHTRQTSPSSTTRKLSCSECRRLKLRCSRVWPCQSCVKRGCASICPTGTLTPGGGGNRFILHGSEELHKKIREMGERIRELEDTVGCLWAAKTGGKEGEHPMLRKELLKIKEVPDTQNVGNLVRAPGHGEGGVDGDEVHHEEMNGIEKDFEVVVKKEEKEDCILSSLGTLTIGDNGRRHYMGRSARLEWIMASEDLTVDPANSSDSASPPGRRNSSSPTPGSPPNSTHPNRQSSPDPQPSIHTRRYPSPKPSPKTATSPRSQSQSHPSPGTSSGAYTHPTSATHATSPSSSSPQLPEEIASLSQSFLCAKPSSSSVTIKQLLFFLPPRQKGLRLVETFFTNAAWFYTPLRKDLFLDCVFKWFYDVVEKAGGDVDLFIETTGSSHPCNLSQPSEGVGASPEANSYSPSPRISYPSPAASSGGHNAPTSASSPAAATATAGAGHLPSGAFHPGPAELSVLFMVLTIGSLLDLSREIGVASDEADRHYTLAKAALCLDNPLEKGCTAAFVQALNLMCCYSIQWSAKSMEIEKNWAIVGLACRMAQSLGLHRDSARWNLPPYETELRRYVFWELFSLDSWTSLAYGRPPALNLRHVDTHFPTDRLEQREAAPPGEEGKVISRSFKIYKYMFVKECVYPVTVHIFDTKRSTYQDIQALDRKVRAFDFGVLASEVGAAEAGNDSGDNGVCSLNGCAGDGVVGAGVDGSKINVAALMQRQLVLCIKENVLLYIHRSYFTRVMTENPNNPLDSPYAASVLATFRCAVTVLQVIRNCLIKMPVLMSRFWLGWSGLMTSAVVTGSICYRGPRCTIAPAAFAQLRIAVELFENSRVHAPRLNYVMPTLYRLQDKAYKAIVAVGPGLTSRLPPPGIDGTLKKSKSRPVSVYASGKDGSRSPSHSQSPHSASMQDGSDRESGGSSEDEDDDPLAAYGGRARVIMLDSAHKANAAAIAASGGNPCPSVVHTVPTSNSGSRNGSKETSPVVGSPGSASGTSKSLKSSLWFDANFMNTNGDSHNPLEFSSFVTSPTNGIVPNSFFTRPVGDVSAGAVGAGPSMNGGAYQGRNATPFDSDALASAAGRGWAPEFTPSPFVQLMQQINQPSNSSSTGTNPTSLQQTFMDASGMTAFANQGTSGGDPIVADDYSWLDGFGMGNTPNAPLSAQTVPMLFGGGASGSGGNPRTQKSRGGSGFSTNVHNINSNGLLQGGRRIGNSGDETEMMNLEKQLLSPGMFGVDRVNNSLSPSMFGLGNSAATHGLQQPQVQRTQSQSQSHPSNQPSPYFPPPLQYFQQEHNQNQNQPMDQGGLQSDWFPSNFAYPDPVNAFDMSMNVDVADPSGGNMRVAEPALNDSSWQEYMRRVFVNGGGDDDAMTF